MTRLMLIWAGVLLISCSVSRTDRELAGFELSGIITDLPPNTMLVLKNTVTNEIDSTVAENGKFVFKGMLPDSISSAQVLLRTKDWSDYRFMWIENTKMNFEGTFKNLRDGKLTGSSAELDNQRLNASTGIFRRKIDSLQLIIDDLNQPEPKRSVAIEESNRAHQSEVDATIKFVSDNPGSIISAHVLDVYAAVWGKDITSRLYEQFSDDVKRSTYGKKIFQYITLARDLKIGDYAIDFEQRTPEGKSVKLSDFKGKVVLMEFWASWCGPCREANPKLVKIYEQYHKRGFEILGVSWDEKKPQWLKAIETDGMKWPQVSELNGDRNTASLIYSVSSIPDNFLIDPTGKILSRNLDSSELSKKLGELFDTYPMASR